MRGLLLGLVAALVSGCGRVGFDVASTGGDGGGSDAALPAVCQQDEDCRGCGSCGANETCSLFGFTRFSFGHVTSLGQAADGSYWGWGANTGDPLDLGLGTTDIATPVRLSSLAPFSNAVIGANIGAGFAADGTIWTWGAGTSPFQLTTQTQWHDLQVAWAWGCALQADNSLWCWGDNYLGNLGDGTNNDSPVPLRVGAFTVAEYSIDQYLGCAIDTLGQLWCWGDNNYLAAGDPILGHLQIPPTRVGTRTDWKHVAVGGGVSCAWATPPAPIECWGIAYNNGQIFDSAAPMPVDPRTDWTLLRSNFDHTCAIATDGSVWCWGANSSGQLGTGDSTFRVPPTQVPLPGAADELALGGHMTCARVSSSWWCWGRNDGGQLGIGTISANVLSPIQRCP